MRQAGQAGRPLQLRLEARLAHEGHRVPECPRLPQISCFPMITFSIEAGISTKEVRVGICMPAHVHVCVCMYARVRRMDCTAQMCLCACVCVRMYVCMHVCVDVHVSVYT